MRRYQEVPNDVSFPALELDVLKTWNEQRTFERSLKQREHGPRFVFHDGPPFATGLPHYGHILTSYMKDVVPRYFTMRGYHVPRRWGWDCHGLPVEHEVEKALGFRSRADVLCAGVETFNDACRSLVMRYQEEWRSVVNRLGRWVDFDHAYKTMDPDYMESVVWCFKKLHDAGLVYESNKVVPYCLRCQTPLSNFEARQDDSFRMRSDPAPTVRFRLRHAVDESLLAWTTTPWTLPSNVALAVHAGLEYVRMTSKTESVWLAAAALSRYSHHLHGYRETQRCLGAQLVNLHYQPVFPYFQDQPNAFRVLASDHVTAEDGTAVVHLAPAFGEEDQVVCSRHDVSGPNPVKDDGTFDPVVVDFAGMGVLDANEQVVQHLKLRGLLFAKEMHQHPYPHCWRCDNPLVYRAVPSWFVKVTAFKDRMLEVNQQVRWVPAHVRDGRFGDWLQNARDWAVSRNRFWGAPVPVWRCGSCARMHVVGGRAELESLSGVPLQDWHRPAVDTVTFPCSCGGVMQRVPEVLDCWFESGAMPYASVHYPFEHPREFNSSFPGEFVVEYVSQTRGWFYTMVALAAGLFGKPPFKNAVCHGVLLGEDGRKLSKRLRNYPDPMDLVNEHGSDALRVGLLSSGAVSGNDLKFSGSCVRDAVRRFHLPLWNALHLLTSYAVLDGFSPSGDVVPSHPLDQYLLHEIEALREELDGAMEAYDLARAYRALEECVTMLSTWYLRLSKPRLWKTGWDDDKRSCYETLDAALVTLVRLVAPFLPFLAESMYHALGFPDSVHLEDWPLPHPGWRHGAVREEMQQLQRLVHLARRVRERNGVKHRHPLRTAWVSGVDAHVLTRHRELLLSELNVKDVRFMRDRSLHVKQEVVLDYARVGKRLRHGVKTVALALDHGEWTAMPQGRLLVAGEMLEPHEFTVRSSPCDGAQGVAVDQDLMVLLDLTTDPELQEESMTRDLNRALQDLRKKARLSYNERVVVALEGPVKWLEDRPDRRQWLAEQVLAVEVRFGCMDCPLVMDRVNVNGDDVLVALQRAPAP